MTSIALPRSDRTAVLVAAAWLAIAAVVVAQHLVLSWWDPDAIGQPLFGRLVFLPLWALATPAILRSGRRLPLSLSRPERLVHHLIHAAGFVIATNVLVRVPLLAVAGPVRFGDSLAQGLVTFGPLALLMFLAIVAIGGATADRPGSPPAAEAVEIAKAVAIAKAVEIAPEAPSASALVEAAAPAPVTSAPATLTLRDGEALRLVPIDEIDLVEADDNYIRVRATGKVLRARARLSDVEGMLDPTRFLRVHRSAIVAAAAIRAVISVNHGDWAVELADGTRVRVARARRAVVAKAVEQLRAGEPAASRLSGAAP